MLHTIERQMGYTRVTRQREYLPKPKVEIG